MEITSFTSADHTNVVTFWAVIFKDMGWNVPRIEGSDDISAFFHFPEGFLMLMKDASGKIVGCAGVKPLKPSTGIVKRFYIAPELRGQGLGKQLLTHVVKESRQRNYTELVLDVYFNNMRAAKFYEQQGFIRYDQKPNDEWKESLAPDKYFYYRLFIN